MLQIRIKFSVCSRRFLQLNSPKKVTKDVNEIALSLKEKNEGKKRRNKGTKLFP